MGDFMNSGFSLLSLFTGDVMTFVVACVLILASIVSWCIIIEKMRLWHREKNKPIAIKSDENFDVVADKLIKPFDKNLWFLSMVSYVAPFVGLFGTVWGVMTAFSAIGVNQSVSIGVVAPGLATALGTTALGLIVAVPAAVAYQYFSKRADDLYDFLIENCNELKQRKK